MEITLTETEWVNLRHAGVIRANKGDFDLQFMAATDAAWRVVRFRGMADKQTGEFTPVVWVYDSLKKMVLTTEIGEKPCLL